MNEELTIAIRAAIHAGRDIMDIYTDPAADFGIERKADNSPLTRADKAAHERIAAYLAPTDIPILSEEGAQLPWAVRRTWKRLWIVDPLDGTKEFIKRNGEFTVNIALVEDGAPVMGVIYVPVSRTLYYATTAHGARKATLTATQADADATRLATIVADIEGEATPLPLADGAARPYTVVASRSHLSLETAAFIDTRRAAHPDLQTASSGSSLKICLVAEGRSDIYPRHAPTMEWDTAAGNAIALAAGRTMVDATTDAPLRYNKEDLHNPWFIVR